MSKALENSDGGAKVVPIVLLRHHALPVHGDHVGAGLGAQAPDIDVCGAFDSDYVFLTRFGREARLVIVVKEGIQSALQRRYVSRLWGEERGSENPYPAP